MTKRNCLHFVTLAVMLMGFSVSANAEKKELQVISFESDNLDKTSWYVETAVTYVENGDTVNCPVVKVRIVNDKLSFQGDIIREELQESGEYWIYMREGATSLKVVDNTAGTETLTIKFSNYNIPSLRRKATYVLVLKIATDLNDFYSKKNAFLFSIGVNIQPGVQHTFYMTENRGSLAGYRIMLGYMYHHLSMDFSMLIGGQSDEKEYTYPSIKDNYLVTNAWGYDQFAVRLGYEYKLAKHLAVTPQLGVIYTEAVDGKLSDLPNPTAWSASIGGRFMLIPFGKFFRLYATPQYNLCLLKNGVYNDIYDADIMAKSYTTGFSIDAGLIFYF